MFKETGKFVKNLTARGINDEKKTRGPRSDRPTRGKTENESKKN